MAKFREARRSSAAETTIDDVMAVWQKKRTRSHSETEGHAAQAMWKIPIENGSLFCVDRRCCSAVMVVLCIVRC